MSTERVLVISALFAQSLFFGGNITLNGIIFPSLKAAGAPLAQLNLFSAIFDRSKPYFATLGVITGTLYGTTAYLYHNSDKASARDRMLVSTGLCLLVLPLTITYIIPHLVTPMKKIASAGDGVQAAKEGMELFSKFEIWNMVRNVIFGLGAVNGVRELLL